MQVLLDGIVFERDTIMHYLTQHTTCPVTQKPLDANQLLSLKQTEIFRPSAVFAAADIRCLVDELQKRFVLLMSENAILAKQRDEAREQVTQLHYIQDGATRVVAEKLEEIDNLRRSISVQSSEPKSLVKIDVEAEFNRFCDQVTKTHALLLQARKARRAVSAQIISNSKSLFSVPEMPSCFKVMIMRACSNSHFEPGLILCGFNNGSLKIYSALSSEEIYSFNTSSRSAITALECILFPSTTHLETQILSFHNADATSNKVLNTAILVVAGFADGSLEVFAYNPTNVLSSIPWIEISNQGQALLNSDPEKLEFEQRVFVPLNCGGIKQLEIHPLGTVVAVLGSSSKWILFSLQQYIVLKTFTLKNTVASTQCFAFQPDGNIATVCTSLAEIPVWDINAGVIRSTLNTQAINGLYTSSAFSQNGYILAAGTSEGQVILWDLRKCTILQILDVMYSVSQLVFDYESRTIGVLTAQNIQILSPKDKKFYFVAKTFLLSHCTAIEWAQHNAAYLLTCNEQAEFTIFFQ